MNNDPVTLVWVFLGTVLIMAVAFARLLRTAARWGRELIELQQHGIEVTGMVVEKREYRRKGAGSRYIRYEYLDQFGQRHRRKVLATPEAWDTHQEGGPIVVLYSSRRPAVSAPKYLVTAISSARSSSDGGITFRIDPPVSS